MVWYLASFAFLLIHDFIIRL